MAEAQESPAKENTFRRNRLNQWTEHELADQDALGSVLAERLAHGGQARFLVRVSL